MKNPFKIIHKFKNNNSRIQYMIYIFIGSLISDEVQNILNSIVNKDFYDTLIFLNPKKRKILEDTYGEKWYKFFFINIHLTFSIKQINRDKKLQKKIIDIHGKSWYNNNIHLENLDVKNLFKKNIPFSFSHNYQNDLIYENKIKFVDNDTIDDKSDIDNYITQKGGMIDDSPISEIIEGNKMLEMFDKKNNEEDEKTIMTNEDVEENINDDFNLDDIMNIYSTIDIQDSKEAKETSKLISEAINDKSWNKQLDKSNDNYNKLFDKNTFDMELSHAYNKVIVLNQYIFEDDTIKNIRNKVAISIPLNPKFGNFKLLPEYQYFWSNYTINNKKDQVMLGQKWIKRNQILNIDIEPNPNLSFYENLADNLLYLKNNFNYKIKREDDEYLILRNYENFITNNEIFMLDIFNDLGINYNIESDKIKNIYAVYTNIYFPLLGYTRFNHIIEALNGNSNPTSALL